MNANKTISSYLLITTFMALGLGACSTAVTRPEGADDARSRLTELQSDSQLASRAQVEIKAAELAVLAAEEPTKDTSLSDHLVVMADRKVEIAKARAMSRLYEDQREALGEQSETARLASRTREADQARRDAEASRTDMNYARREAAAARRETAAAEEVSAELRQQLAELNARETDRGLVMTLGDVLFETGKSELRGGTAGNLAKLAVFLDKYKDRTVIIEGHTDNTGSEAYNINLSRLRAESVKTFLVGQGIGTSRLATTGKGMGSPVADNATATGRQQNRRVEIIISNETVSQR